MRYIFRLFSRIWLSTMFIALTAVPALAIGYLLAGGHPGLIKYGISHPLFTTVMNYATLMTAVFILAALAELPPRKSSRAESHESEDRLQMR